MDNKMRIYISEYPDGNYVYNVSDSNVNLIKYISQEIRKYLAFKANKDYMSNNIVPVCKDNVCSVYVFTDTKSLPSFLSSSNEWFRYITTLEKEFNNL